MSRRGDPSGENTSTTTDPAQPPSNNNSCFPNGTNLGARGRTWCSAARRSENRREQPFSDSGIKQWRCKRWDAELLPPTTPPLGTHPDRAPLTGSACRALTSCGSVGRGADPSRQPPNRPVPPLRRPPWSSEAPRPHGATAAARVGEAGRRTRSPSFPSVAGAGVTVVVGAVPREFFECTFLM